MPNVQIKPQQKYVFFLFMYYYYYYYYYYFTPLSLSFKNSFLLKIIFFYVIFFGRAIYFIFLFLLL
ncbi:hypothetical protein ACMBCN_00430 [Candidatus Liberibacter asiaticus]